MAGCRGCHVKVAIVHYWLTAWRGGERVLEELLRLYPGADVYCHVADPALLAKRLPGVRVRETFIARLPFARRLYRMYLPLMPKALEDLDLQDYDLVISSESGPAKGIIKRPDALHICYCHSPMRYLWDLAGVYRRELGPVKGGLLSCFAPFLRMWDVTSAWRVDRFVANSAFVAQRIKAYYGRESVVIHPPVEVAALAGPRPVVRDPYYLVAGELVGYKRNELAVQAATRLGRRLVVVGEGTQRALLQQMAGPCVEFVGKVDDAQFRHWLAGARALLFPGLEDFGMVPVEAMACGTPLIAYARGGACEYLQDGLNGIGFALQNCDSLLEAMLRFESLEESLDPQAVRDSVATFDRAGFGSRFAAVVADAGSAASRPPGAAT